MEKEVIKEDCHLSGFNYKASVSILCEVLKKT